MTEVGNTLSGVTRLGIDTSPIIYYIENHPVYESLVTPVFDLIKAGALVGLTSVISLLEVLTQPLRQGNARLCGEYRDLLLHSRNFEVVSLDAGRAELAAALRAEFGIRTPDALQLAAAIQSRCEAFLTNDASLKRVSQIRVLTVDELGKEVLQP